MVHNLRLRAFETNERRMAKFSESMDPSFRCRNAAVLQYTHFADIDESMSNAATPKPGRFEEERAKLDLAPTIMRGKADLQEAALIVKKKKPELAITVKLLTRSALVPFGCGEVKIKHGENEDRSAGKLVVPKVAGETTNDEQGPSVVTGKNEKRDDEKREDRQPQEPMEQDQAGRDYDGASLGRASSLDFNFWDDDEVGAETLAGTIELGEDETSALKPPSAFMDITYDLLEKRSPSKTKIIAKEFFTESPRRRIIEGAARVTFLGTLPEGE